MIRYLQNCRLCGSPHLELVLDLEKQYVQGAFLTKNNPNPPKRKIPNAIVRCDPKKGGCSLVQSNITPPPEILFSSYFYKSGINETMRSHLKFVVDELLKFNPNPSRVLDIASNDNTLLLNYPSATEKWGIDPNNIAVSDKENDITVVNDFFPPKTPLPANNDFITMLAVMYDVSNPVHFVKQAFNKLSPKGVLCLEVMYLPTMIKNLNWDTFLGEHLTHWSLFTLEELIRKAGGEIVDAKLTSTNGGSILLFAVNDNYTTIQTPKRRANILELKKDEFDMALDEQNVFTNFRDRVEQHKRDLNTILRKLKKEGKKICLYGCSTKVNVLIEGAKIEDCFSYGIERSEEKVGGQTLWGLPIISEDEARGMVDENTVWFCGPYFFIKSILSRERVFLEKGGSLFFPLPQIKIINKENYKDLI